MFLKALSPWALWAGPAPRLRGLGLAALAAALSLPLTAATAQTFKVLHDFGAGADGQGPLGALIYKGGKLYGMTGGGGADGLGSVFSVAHKSGKEEVIYNFTNGQDGGIPYAGLVKAHGLLYGTTQIGGAGRNGTVVSIDPATGAETTLYAFTGGSDGGSPLAALTYHDGKLYGTTVLSGSGNKGTIFSIDIKSGLETTLYSFTGGTGGGFSIGRLIYDNNVLYGTTEIGGPGKGTVFSFDLKTLTETVLYGFTGGEDGGAPQAGVTMIGDYLYGTTSTDGSSGYGTVFRVNARTGKEKTLVEFTGSNGADPLTELTADGNVLYGTTDFGGSTNDGTLFSVDLSTGVMTTLYTFQDGNDGEYPQSGLLIEDGVIYGTSAYGGPDGEGAAFALTLP
jgi:uncharacterized repeat protein (TIGR03803 family)